MSPSPRFESLSIPADQQLFQPTPTLAAGDAERASLSDLVREAKAVTNATVVAAADFLAIYFRPGSDRVDLKFDKTGLP
jgi:hypothetical protein